MQVNARDPCVLRPNKPNNINQPSQTSLSQSFYLNLWPYIINQPSARVKVYGLLECEKSMLCWRFNRQPVSLLLCLLYMLQVLSGQCSKHTKTFFYEQPEPEFRPPMSEVVQALVRLVQRANMSKRTVGNAARQSDGAETNDSVN